MTRPIMIHFIRTRFAAWIAASLLLVLIAAPVMAGTMVLGTSGWTASWDVSLDGLVDFVVDGETANAVIIQKFAEFTQGPGFGGIMPPINVTFTQNGPNPKTFIVMNDEVITNSTGVDWTDFHMDIVNGGDVAFNRTLTDASNGGAGFSTAPFVNQSWGGWLGGDHYESFEVDGFGLGGTVDDGTVWNPGGGALDGELFIELLSVKDGITDFTVFSLKERPTIIPEPASALLLMAGVLGLVGFVRRRR